ncbi:MAG: deoxyribonuclease [Gaiellaceae bacterium]|jgi:deoxyribonuclease-4|nr:deoxyribonuclease [Gaiellaceae bacterium]
MRIGAHLSPAGGIDKAVDRAVAIGADAVQVFTQNPRAWRPTNHDPASFERFREKHGAAGLGGALCHATYLCNMAAKDDVTYERSVLTLCHTTAVAREIGAHVVFHVGSHLGAGLDAGLERVIPALEQALELCTDETWLLMENSAGAGGTIGRSIEELATIHDRMGRPERLGVCLDSCHLYVSGVDVTDPATLDACLDELDAAIGLDKLRALHVNDSLAPFGSNRDRHANILEGELGEKMGVFLANPRLQGLPAVLETAGPEGRGPDAAEIQKTKDLRARHLS